MAPESRPRTARPARAALLAVLMVCGLPAAPAQDGPAPAIKVTLDWNQTRLVSRTTPTLQVVVNPPLRPGSAIHDPALAALRALQARYVRYVPWLPYPRLAVAELEPPTRGSTSWDFSLIDPMTADFLAAAGDRPTVMNFSTIPAWMFKSPRRQDYPANPDQVFWDYEHGTQLRDPSGKELGDYFARLVGWYVNGGFTDENGREHRSGHHYDFPVWEVLNEVDFEHAMTPEQYTLRYDAIVEAVRRVSPRTKFMGLALAMPSKVPGFFEYFLDPAHHRPGVPVDYISYHFYASPGAGTGPHEWQYAFFDQADRFLATVNYIEAIRKRLAPGTRTDTDEIGAILPGDPGSPAAPPAVIAPRYWNAAAAVFSYVYIGLARDGIELVGESQLVGYPTQFPSVTMLDWKTGRPNARYWVLKLLIDHLHPGDRLVETDASGSDDVEAQAFATPAGREILLVNKRDRPVAVELPAGSAGAGIVAVDEASGDRPAREGRLAGRSVVLAPFAVALVSLR